MTLTRRSAGRLILAGGGLALAGCGRTSRATLRAADSHPDGYPTVEAVKEMARLLRTWSSGRLDIHIYAGGQLGAERDTLEITSFGGLDLNRVSLAPLNAIEPMTIVPSLPFLFRSEAHMRAALDGPIGAEILGALTARGLVGLCFFDSGDRSIYNTRRPINTPSDMRGLKIRVPNSDLYVDMIRAMGGDATPMALGEAYQALVQGVIDGAENNWPSYESGRHFEVARYYSLTRHIVAPEALVMSLDRWRRLTAEEQGWITEAARAAVIHMRQLWDARVARSREVVLADGILANEVADHAAFVRLVEPIWAKFVETPAARRAVDAILAMGGSA